MPSVLAWRISRWISQPASGAIGWHDAVAFGMDKYMGPMPVLSRDVRRDASDHARRSGLIQIKVHNRNVP
jgi:hypothetical protein